ncbi:hypothetical protein [Pseudomonas ovata]|uniref:hypothetical protein n=1 Tax=Pseudomonas ovata TaxID=1839709 RepID=UPI0030C87E53
MIKHPAPAQGDALAEQRRLDGVGVQAEPQVLLAPRRRAVQRLEPGLPGHPAFGGGVRVDQLGLEQFFQ